MSNSRMFAMGFAAYGTVVLVLGLCGINPRYTGIEKTIGNFLIGSSWGIALVAIAGDRQQSPHYREEN